MHALWRAPTKIKETYKHFCLRQISKLGEVGGFLVDNCLSVNAYLIFNGYITKQSKVNIQLSIIKVSTAGLRWLRFNLIVYDFILRYLSTMWALSHVAWKLKFTQFNLIF